MAHKLQEMLKPLIDEQPASRKEMDDTPAEARVAYLISKGWTFKTGKHKLLGNEPVEMTWWYAPDKPQHGYPLWIAYKYAKALEARDERKEAIREYKASIPCNKCGEETLKRTPTASSDAAPMGYYGLIDAEVSGGVTFLRGTRTADWMMVCIILFLYAKNVLDN